MLLVDAPSLVVRSTPLRSQHEEKSFERHHVRGYLGVDFAFNVHITRENDTLVGEHVYYCELFVVYSHSRLLVGDSLHWLVQHRILLCTDGVSVLVTGGRKQMYTVVHSLHILQRTSRSLSYGSV